LFSTSSTNIHQKLKQITAALLDENKQKQNPTERNNYPETAMFSRQ
jgi:hypothetical protein